MAYTPTLEDTPDLAPQASGYVPTLEDTPELSASANQSPQNWIQRAASDVQQHINEPVQKYFGDPMMGFIQGNINAIPQLYNLAKSGINKLAGTNLPEAGNLVDLPETTGNKIGNIATWLYPSAKIGASLIGKGINALSAGKIAGKLSDTLGQGTSNLTSNAKSLASDIQDAYRGHKANYEALRKPVFDKYADTEIYPLQNKTGYLAERNIPDFNMDNASNATKDMFDNFKKSPTLKNAQDLQSELGAEIGRVKMEPASSEKNNRLGDLTKIRDTLKDQMDKSLRPVDPEAADQLKRASDYYKNNVVPYRATTKLEKIAENHPKANFKNIHNIFSTPNKTIEKVVSDLAPESKNKILFSAIGGPQKDATRLLEKLDKAKSGNFSNYFHSGINNDIQSLRNSLSRQGMLKKVGIGGGILSSLYGGYEGVNSLAHKFSSQGSE